MANPAKTSARRRASQLPSTLPQRRRGRPRQSPEATDRRDLILDAAEALFSAHGFHGVAMREVASEAGVDAALLGYYFGSKRGLFDATFLRRAEEINAARLESMRRYERSTAALTVEGCLQSFFEPVLQWWEFGGQGRRNYLRLVALINNTPAWGSKTIAEHFDPVVRTLVDLLQQALPDARREDLYWCYHFVSGALSLSFADTGRIDSLSDGLCRSSDVAAVRKRLAYFMAAGTTDLCRQLAK